MASDPDPDAVSMVAGELKGFCTSDDKQLLMMCGGYVGAISDIMVGMGVASGKPLFCMPPGLSVDKEREIVIAYVENHPELATHNAAMVVQQALATVLSCPKGD
jgi:hypothetical protein